MEKVLFMKAEQLMLLIEAGVRDPEDLTLDQMNKLSYKYGFDWWKFKDINFDSNPLMWDTEGSFSIRKRPW